MMHMLSGRELIEPGDLPAFGAEVLSNIGDWMEIVAWFSTSSDGRVSFAHERVALGFVYDGKALPEMRDGGMIVGYAPESAIVSQRPPQRRFPRFNQWLIGVILPRLGSTPLVKEKNAKSLSSLC